MAQPFPYTRIKLASCCLSLSIVLSLFALLSGSVFFWDSSLLTLAPSGSSVGAAALLFLSIAFILVRFRIWELDFEASPFFWGLALVFLSDWLSKPYSLLQGPSIRGEILLGGLLTILLLRKHRIDLIWLFLPINVVLLSVGFISEAKGQLLFSDDNATFFYRLQLLKEHFPNIPFYNPFWNGGYDARDFFATGSLNIFLIFYALIELCPLEVIYNFLIAHLLFIISPLLIYLSARIEKLPPKGAALAALLSLATSMLWYRWSLKYGTLGFTTTTILIPLNLALAARILAPDVVIRWPHAVAFIVSFSLMLFWSLSAVVFVPILILAALRPVQILRKHFVKTIVLAILALNLPWLYILFSVSNVASFIHAEKSVSVAGSEAEKSEKPANDNWRFKQRAGSINLKKSLKSVREFSAATNPLIIFLVLPGIFLLPKRSRLPYGITYAWLLLLGIIVPPLKPQLELDRMLVIFAHCAAVPAAFAIFSLLSKAQEQQRSIAWGLLFPGLVGGFLIAGPLSVSGIIRNRTLEQISFASPNVEAMVNAIKKFGGLGRTLFSGCVVHELSQGHLAPLALWSGHALMASSPVHNLWNYRQIFPREYLLREDAGIDDYLNLYNVSAVMAHEPEWRNYFLKRPAQFKEVWNGESFKMFERIGYQSSYFLEGSGELLAQTENQVRLKLHSAEAVIKFNYFPFLKSSACKLSAKNVSESVSLIQLRDCPLESEVIIDSVGPLERILGMQ